LTNKRTENSPPEQWTNQREGEARWFGTHLVNNTSI